MELILNLLWALIALCALCVWRMRWVRQERSSRRSPVQEWTAFLCGLVLLFFAVSMTDDLHSEIVLFDECASGRRSSAVCSFVHASPGSAKIHAECGLVILPRMAAPKQFVVASMVSTFPQTQVFHFDSDVSSGRAPPVVIL